MRVVVFCITAVIAALGQANPPDLDCEAKSGNLSTVIECIGAIKFVQSVIEVGADLETKYCYQDRLSFEGPFGLVNAPKLAQHLAEAMLDNSEAPKCQYPGTLLRFAVIERNTPLVQALIEAGADPLDGHRPLAFALSHSDRGGINTAIADILVKAAPKTDVQLLIDNHLSYAAIHGNADAMQYLIHKKANVEAMDKDGATPLMRACQRRQSGACPMEVLQVLLDARANLETKGPHGGTALFWFAAHGNEAMVQSLLHARANPAAARSNGVTAVMAAKNEGHENVVKMLTGPIESRLDL